MKTILYTIGCPKCNILKKKLISANISFTVCEDTKIMTEKGISQLPILEIDGKTYDFVQSVELINKGGIAQ